MKVMRDEGMKVGLNLLRHMAGRGPTEFSLRSLVPASASQSPINGGVIMGEQEDLICKEDMHCRIERLKSREPDFKKMWRPEAMAYDCAISKIRDGWKGYCRYLPREVIEKIRKDIWERHPILKDLLSEVED